jgi:DNA-binding transcriptional LysR family regulator
MIQIYQLEGFYWVAVHEGYARAARAFPYPITQPGVYQQVRKLELDLGQTLFDRIGHDRVALTAAGRRLFQFCAPFFRELPEVVRDIESGLSGGPLRIEAGALEVRYVLPPWLRRIRAKHPALRIDLREIEAPDFDRLRRGEVDVIVEHVPDCPSDLEARTIGVHHGFLVLSSDCTLKKGRAAQLAQLARLPFISFHPSQREHALQMAALRARGLEPARVISSTGTESILGFVEAGLGFSIVPWPARRGPERRGVRCIRQGGPGTVFPISAVWKRAEPPSPAILAALELVHAAR